ncbi:NAD-dependent epimerase/dehydratase family protein [Actinotignum urinale]|uniref:NAD-dependent epimerase/dehydratase family protein n=1 Tax=Actinotignum urinale TaxID=190146 RepID=UPI0003B5116F|nr:NAD-dependent epimerase/dehydratase family protein [Actinotignum urinale]MDY5159740.1 GDP-mannose 4,6-dehydratase [Actinotignum urinale]
MQGTCLITGGAGFIGCALSHLLVGKFDRIVAVDNLHPQVHAKPVRPIGLHPHVELVIGDVANNAMWDSLLKDTKPTVVIHLAAETGTSQSLLEATRHATVNVIGTTQMTDAFARHDTIPEKIILPSSRAVYGEGRWQDENGEFVYPGMRTHEMLVNGEWDFKNLHPTAQEASTVTANPANVYAATKLAQENLLASWCGSMGSECVTFRLQNVYGVGQSLTNPYTGIISMFVRWAKAGKTIPVYEDGNIIRDFVYISDVAEAIVAGVLHGHATPHAYDVGTGVQTSVMDVARIATTTYGAPEPQITGQFREGDIRAGWADISRTTKDLGWEPRVSLQEGMRLLTTWLDEGGQI